MSETVNFIVDAALIDRLGRELVSKQETALIELVKNCFDADATNVTVRLDGQGAGAALTIADDGLGMTRDQLVNGFLRLASDAKVREPISPKFQRQRAGRKGIGRFATQRLGSRLRLKTWHDPDMPGQEIFVDWERFTRGERLEEIPLVIFEIAPRGTTGTDLEIERLRDEWSDTQIKRCWRGLLALQRPFPIAPIKNLPTKDPGFTVAFFRGGNLYDSDELVADIQTEILDYAHGIIDLEVDQNGHARWRLSQNYFGPDRDWSRIHHAQGQSRAPEAYEHLHDISMRAYYFVLDRDYIPSIVYTQLRDVLAEDAGIRLYRNGFRVVPYGQRGNDWLRLDERYTQRSVLMPIQNRNFYGFVEVDDPEGGQFEEHTSREGLIENAPFAELRDLVSSTLITAAEIMAAQRGRKTRAGGASKPPAPVSDFVRQIRDAAKEAEEGASQTNNDGVQGTNRPNYAALLNRAGDALEAGNAEIADALAMLRMLATLGLTMAEFSHETGMAFESAKLDATAVFKSAMESSPNDQKLRARAQRAQSMIDRLYALTNYLNEVAAARSARTMAPVSVKGAINEMVKGLTEQALAVKVKIKPELPEYDPLFTVPMHGAEVASILLNFYSNSIKALKEVKVERRILIDAKKEDGNVVFRFSDNGDGIPAEHRPHIFDQFFTTRVAPSTAAPDNEQMRGTGLGLWIVKQIVDRARGSVKLVDPPEGYSTCFEVSLPAEVS